MSIVDIHSDSEREVWWAWIVMNLQDWGWTASPQPETPNIVRLDWPSGTEAPILVDSSDTKWILGWLTVIDQWGVDVSAAADGIRSLAVEFQAAGLIEQVRVVGLRATVGIGPAQK